MNSDSGDTAEYPAKATVMNFQTMRVTGKGFRITENSSKSKHSLGYVEMKI
jgi:hypothetical protein